VKKVLAAFVAGVALVASSRAEASCGVPPLLTVVPTLARKAPTNAHVWVTLPATWRATGLCDPRLSDTPCPQDTFSIGLRRAPMLGRARPWLAVAERESPLPRYLLKDALGERTVELVPASPLDASTLYEVHLRAATSASDEVIGLFETGTSPDTTAPTWRGAPTGKFGHARARPGTILLSECGEPTARFEKLDTADAETPAADLRFEIRVREMTEPHDVLRVPDAVKPTFTDGRQSFSLWLGSSDDTSDDGLIPRDQRPVSVSLVIVDWAGNRSDERALELR